MARSALLPARYAWLAYLVLAGIPASPGFATDFSSAGRVESTAVGGSCTGVLIDSNIVLTAAHCVNPSYQWYIFRPGDGDFPGKTYPVDMIHHHPKYAELERSLERQKYDIAISRLANAVEQDRVQPARIGTKARLGEELFVASWRRDGTSRPNIRACSVVEPYENHLTLDCAVERGESGAPVFRKSQGQLELVGLISTSARHNGARVALVVDVPDTLPALTPLLK